MNPYQISIQVPHHPALSELLHLAAENGVAGDFEVTEGDSSWLRRVTFRRDADVDADGILRHFDAGVALDTSAILHLYEQMHRLGKIAPTRIPEALLSSEARVHGLNPSVLEGLWRGLDGKHEWCVGIKDDESGFPVFVDDRPIGFRKTRHAAKSHALDIVARLRADGDYRLNDKPPGHLPPPQDARLKRLSESELSALCERALDAACAVIQAEIGQSDGGVAAIHFSGNEDIFAQLRAYVETEYAFEDRTSTPRERG